MGRLKIAFPYIVFLCMGLGVYWSNVRGTAGAPMSDATDASSGAQDAASLSICPPCGMTVAENEGVTAEIDGRTQRFCCSFCRNRHLNERTTVPQASADERLIDPVCKMDVNAAWGFAYDCDGTTFYFCAERCRDEFAANPDAFIGERCLVCRTPVDVATALSATYIEKTYYMCSEEHRAEFKADPAGFFMHRMWGIPDWLYYVSIAVLLLVSFLIFEGAAAFRRRGQLWHRRLGGEDTGGTPVPQVDCDRRLVPDCSAHKRSAIHGDRIDLMRFGVVRAMLLSRLFRFAVQFVMVAVFLLILAAGMFGNQNPGLNIAPLLTWTVWWGGLVVLIMFAGKAWCYMCPWDALAGWAEKLSFWKKKDDGFGLNLRWPRVIRNIWIATFFFVGLTWIELGFGVTMKPVITAYLGLLMLVLAIVSAFLFERKSFCRYGCLIGRVSGLYAMFAGIEVRRRGDQICHACRTKECVKGSQTAYGCPTFEYPGAMKTNTYCIQCAECLQACPHDNLAVNLRPWGEDLKVEGKPRRDEAYLALLMLALTGFHGLTMTPVWASITGALEAWLPLGQIASFSLGMLGLMAFPILIYTVLVWISYKLTTGSAVLARSSDHNGSRQTGAATYYDYFIRYAYCVLPIALFYHLAHNLEHLLMEGQKVLALISDPFGWGWNVFGTARWVVPPLVSLDVLWILQVTLVAIGHVYSLWAASRITRRLFVDHAAARRGQWPMLLGMIAFSVFSLWLLKQPMEMRTSAM